MSYHPTAHTAPNLSMWPGQVLVTPQQGDAKAQEDDGWPQCEGFLGESVVYLCEAPTTENEEDKENEGKEKDK